MRPVFTLLLNLLLVAACTAETPRQLDYEIETTYPHDTSYFTQGLLFYEGVLIESTGRYGHSKVVRYQEDYSGTQMRRSLPPRYFAEGIAIFDDQLYQLTWRSGKSLVYDPADLSIQGEFSYQGEGWGLTADAQGLWMSDGSATLTRLDREGRSEERIRVTLKGEPLDRLNELEYVDGYILANRWYDSRIYAIDPASGKVAAILNLSELAKPHLTRNREHVLNGAAWHPERQTLWVTGKNWNRLYELQVPALTTGP